MTEKWNQSDVNGRRRSFRVSDGDATSTKWSRSDFSVFNETTSWKETKKKEKKREKPSLERLRRRRISGSIKRLLSPLSIQRKRSENVVARLEINSQHPTAISPQSVALARCQFVNLSKGARQPDKQSLQINVKIDLNLFFLLKYLLQIYIRWRWPLS